MKIQYDLKLFLILILEIFIIYYTSRSINHYTSDLLCNILYIVLIKYIGNLPYRLNGQHRPDCGIQELKRLYMRGSSTSYK
jgi:hypothetical protein